MELNDINEKKAAALKELEPIIKPAKEFKDFVKNALNNGADTIGTSQLSNWLISIPLMYGELRNIEAEFVYTVEELDRKIEVTKAEVISQNAGGKATDARALAVQAVSDLQGQRNIAKLMASKINAEWSEFEMLIFSVRNLFEARQQKVQNDI